MVKIPDKALEAGARTITLALMHVVDEDSALPLTDDERAELARTACLAMLEAWPGARERPYWDLMTNTRHIEIVLPEA